MAVIQKIYAKNKKETNTDSAEGTNRKIAITHVVFNQAGADKYLSALSSLIPNFNSKMASFYNARSHQGVDNILGGGGYNKRSKKYCLWGSTTCRRY